MLQSCQAAKPRFRGQQARWGPGQLGTIIREARKRKRGLLQLYLSASLLIIALLNAVRFGESRVAWGRGTIPMGTVLHLGHPETAVMYISMFTHLSFINEALYIHSFIHSHNNVQFLLQCQDDQ
jgi:hypothetical protein